MFLFLFSTKSIKIVRNKVIVSFYKKLKVYNKKVIDFVWENMMTSFFVAYGPRKLGPSTRQKTRSSYFFHTKSITYIYIKSTKMTNDTLKQYCQIFETTRLFFKTTKRFTCMTLCTKQNNKNNKTLALHLHYNAVKLCTTTL